MAQVKQQNQLLKILTFSDIKIQDFNPQYFL